MKFIHKAFIFLRLIDEHDGNISLTNIAVMVCLVKLILVPNASLTDIGALFLSLTNYTGKKLINKSASNSDSN